MLLLDLLDSIIQDRNLVIISKIKEKKGPLLCFFREGGGEQNMKGKTRI